jgi:hypothetical protein
VNINLCDIQLFINAEIAVATNFNRVETVCGLSIHKVITKLILKKTASKHLCTCVCISKIIDCVSVTVSQCHRASHDKNFIVRVHKYPINLCVRKQKHFVTPGM